MRIGDLIVDRYSTGRQRLLLIVDFMQLDGVSYFKVLAGDEINALPVGYVKEYYRTVKHD